MKSNINLFVPFFRIVQCCRVEVLSWKWVLVWHSNMAQSQTRLCNRVNTLTNNPLFNPDSDSAIIISGNSSSRRSNGFESSSTQWMICQLWDTHVMCKELWDRQGANIEEGLKAVSTSKKGILERNHHSFITNGLGECWYVENVCFCLNNREICNSFDRLNS